MSKECIAMILAGGQGSRLGTLTKNIAKPAVPFGAKYKIIDFVLSNCSHSGIDTVGVLTQYQPLELNTYIGNGQSWDLDRQNGGVYILPPFVNTENFDWYKGTANAIYQNIGFIDQYSPENVLILSGDHIYKMDYSKMIKQHIKNSAKATIAAIDVPIEETHMYGIISTNNEGEIIDFAEKPSKAKSNLASMGVYVFNWKTLKKYLMVDENNAKSSNDFGKNIIPSMLMADEKMCVYNFDGYWKDVGTLKSFWQANMDLASENPPLNLYDEWKIFSKTPVKPPHFTDANAKVTNSLIAEGSELYGAVKNSVIFEGAVIQKGAIVENSIIMANAKICENAVVKKSVVANNAIISIGAHIGVDNATAEFESEICSDGITLIGKDVYIDSNVKIGKNCMVDIDVANRGVDIDTKNKQDKNKMIS